MYIIFTFTGTNNRKIAAKLDYISKSLHTSSFSDYTK